MSFLNEPIQSILIQPKRQIGSIAVNVVISEEATDTLEITDQPIQQGAAISDHAFKLPTIFGMRASWRVNTLGDSLATIYKNLLTLQNSLIVFTIITPKRIYPNCLFKTLTQVTDKTTENCLMVTMNFKQIIIVPVTTSTAARINQSNAGLTGATQAAGQKQSFLYTGAQAIGVRP